ncbi:MAG: serine/threonine protein kinase, partial [Planctomycetes bacterium]|nr:serine/threonine protein kinase [Planctomycetota bacterium]
AVTKALKSAWECGEQIIHRDIKPSNIMLAFPPQVLASGKLVMKEARIKVMDFGLARLAQRTEDAGLTTEGMIVGTPRYISPEQALGKPVDIRSDIYSLGIVLYELTTGKLSFESDSAMGYVQQRISAIAPLPRLINPQITSELETVILKCIHKSPEERYRTPSELMEDLESLRLKRQPQHSKSEIPTRVSGRKWLLLLLMLAVFGLAGAITLSL